MLFFYATLTAMVISVALIPALMKVAPRFHLVDKPNSRTVSSTVVPRIGGIAMVTAAVIPILLWAPLSQTLLSLVAGILIILIFGVWDDRNNLSYRVKFFGQLLAIFCVVFYGEITIERIPFAGMEPLPPYISIPLTIFALLGITNAINLSDGLDGLAGGVTLLSFFGVALLSFIADGSTLTLIALIIVGSIFGFLRFNTWPANLFMGDSGSQFLGFSLGVLVIMLTQQVHPALSPVVALMLLGFPILDTVFVMFVRMKNGYSPFTADKNHMHHKLLELKFRHYEAVIIIYMAQATMVLIAYLFRYDSDALLMSLYAVLFIVTVLFIRFGHETRGVVERQKEKARKSSLGKLLQYIRHDGNLKKYTYSIASTMISAFIVLVAFNVDKVPGDLGVMAALLFCILVVSLLSGNPKLELIFKGVSYGTCVLMVYLLLVYPGDVMINYPNRVNIFFALLALIVVVALRFSWNKEFRATPMDFIVVFLSVVVPNLPDTHFQQYGMSIAKVIVLFYGLEFIMRVSNKKIILLNVATISTLAIVSVRGIT